MDGPGEYLPDVTEGITRVEDLPKAKVARRSRNYTPTLHKSKALLAGIAGFPGVSQLFVAGALMFANLTVREICPPGDRRRESS